MKPDTYMDSHFAHWALRIAVSATFIFHGALKFGDLAGGAEKFGVSTGLWTLVAILEIVGPILLLIGGLLQTKVGDLLTRAAAAAGIGILIGAIALVHWGQWNFVASDSHPMGGMEFQVSLLVIHLYFVLRGNNA